MTRVASRWSSEAQLDLLVSPSFLAALVLLVLNDRLLKTAYPGLVTGKLSDFAGLFAFTIFLIALRPTSTRTFGVAITIMFAWWKSPLSQAPIDAWNIALPYHVGRVVDATDLVALLSMPAAVAYARHLPRETRSRLGWAVLVASSAAFAGSLGGGASNETIYRISSDDASAVYAFPFAPDELAQRLDDTGLFHGADVSGSLLPYSIPGTYGIGLDDCSRSVVEVLPLDAGTALRLDYLAISHRCGPSSEAALRQLFEWEVVERLRGTRPAAPPRAVPILATPYDYPAEGVPSLMLTGSLADAVQRLSSRAVLSHDYHDGVYQLGSLACRGRFRMAEAPDRASVLVEGVGYDVPCYEGASQACLAHLFEAFIAEPQDPAPTPAAMSTTVAAPGATCPKRSGRSRSHPVARACAHSKYAHTLRRHGSGPVAAGAMTAAANVRLPLPPGVR